MSFFRRAGIVIALLCVDNFILHAEDDTFTLINGGFASIGTFVTSGANNVLVISNKANVTLSKIATSSTAVSNTVVVSGAAINGGIHFSFAEQGSSNALYLLDNGTIASGLRDISIGSTAGIGSDNLLQLERTKLGDVAILIRGASRQRFVAIDSSITKAFSSSSTVIDAAESLLSLVGTSWTENNLTVTGAVDLVSIKAASVFSASSVGIGGVSNRVEILGAGTTWTNKGGFTNGFRGEGFNTVEVGDGAFVYSRPVLSMGYFSLSNQVIASGANTILEAAGSLIVGDNGDSNALKVLSGAQLTVRTNTVIGNAGMANSILVSGTGSTGTFGKISMGGSSNLLAVSDGGSAVAASMLANGLSNRISVLPDANLQVDGELRLAGGAQLEVVDTTISSGSANGTNGGNLFRISGSHGSWTIMTNLTFSGSTNALYLLDGAQLTAPRLDFGPYLSGSGIGYGFDNAVYARGPGTILAILNITANSERQSVAIADGASLRTESVVSSRGGLNISVAGPNATWFHSGDAIIGQVNAPLPPDVIHISNGGLVTNQNTIIGNDPRAPGPAVGGPFGRAVLTVEGASTRLLTGGNFWIGRNANGNSASILDGAEVSAQNVEIGTYDWGLQPNHSFLASQNELRISGGGSRFKIETNLSLGRSSSNNRLIISDGGFISAAKMTVSASSSGDSVWGGQTNSVIVDGVNSSLQLIGSYLAGDQGSLEVTGGGKVVAGADLYTAWMKLDGVNSSAHVGGRFRGINLGIGQGGHLDAHEVILQSFSLALASIQGDHARMDAAAIHLSRNDDLISSGPGKLTFAITDSGEVNTFWLSMGVGNPGSTNLLTVDGGLLAITSLNSTGLVEIENGRLELRSGIVRADQLRETGPGASLEVTDAVLAGSTNAPSSGQLQIGGENGNAELRGTNILGGLFIGNSGSSTGSVAILQGTTVIHNESGHAQLAIGEDGQGELSIVNSAVAADQITLAARGSAKLTLGAGARLTSGNMIQGAGSEVDILVSAPSSTPVISVAATAQISGQLKVTLPVNYTLQAGDSVRLLSAEAVTGEFENAPNGSRVAVADSPATFLITYAADGIILGDFRAKPQEELRMQAFFDASLSKLTLSFPAAAGGAAAMFSVQESFDLAEWHDIQDPHFETAGDAKTWTTDIDLSAPQKFFRIVSH